MTTHRGAAPLPRGQARGEPTSRRMSASRSRCRRGDLVTIARREHHERGGIRSGAWTSERREALPGAPTAGYDHVERGGHHKSVHEAGGRGVKCNPGERGRRR